MGWREKMDLETDFYYMILLKREIILSIIILKGGFQTIQLYLLSYSVRSDSPQLFFQDLTGRLLVPAVYAGPVLYRLLYVCWFSLHFVLNSSGCSSECLGLYFMWLHLLLIVMYYLKSIVLCFRQAICNVCIFMTWILWVVCFIIAFDKCFSAKNF